MLVILFISVFKYTYFCFKSVFEVFTTFTPLAIFLYIIHHLVLTSFWYRCRGISLVFGSRVRKLVNTSIKISIASSTKYDNMDIIHLWKVAGALHNPNDILLKAKVPYKGIQK